MGFFKKFFYWFLYQSYIPAYRFRLLVLYLVANSGNTVETTHLNYVYY